MRKRVGRIGKFVGIFSTVVYFISRRNWSMLNFPPARRYRYRPWIPFLPFRRGFSLSKGRIFYEISMKFRIQRIYIYIYRVSGRAGPVRWGFRLFFVVRDF